jgi:hypothetical protein
MAIHRPLTTGRVRTQKSASTGWKPAIETILANPFVSSGPLPVRHPLTGLCAFALAFSTLLSSQGADAHRHKAFAWLGGNPLSLPASSRAVKRVHLTLTTSQPQVPPAYPAADRPDVRTAHGADFSWLAPGTGRLPAFPTSCLGADETLGIHATHVKSRARPSLHRRSATRSNHPRIRRNIRPAPADRLADPKTVTQLCSRRNSRSRTNSRRGPASYLRLRPASRRRGTAHRSRPPARVVGLAGCPRLVRTTPLSRHRAR